MLITRGFGYNTGSGGSGETVYIYIYIYAPDPTVVTSSFGQLHIVGDVNLPSLKVTTDLELKPIINSNNDDVSLVIGLLKPSLHIQED